MNANDQSGISKTGEVHPEIKHFVAALEGFLVRQAIPEADLQSKLSRMKDIIDGAWRELAENDKRNIRFERAVEAVGLGRSLEILDTNSAIRRQALDSSLRQQEATPSAPPQHVHYIALQNGQSLVLTVAIQPPVSAATHAEPASPQASPAI